MSRAVALAGILLVAGLVAACGSSTERTDARRRTWRGPTDTVASQGITTYERREIAQKVEFPACLFAGNAVFRFENVRPVAGGDALPPGMFDTGYSLDKWRLVAPIGILDQLSTLFVIARGSTGIVAAYPRQPAGSGC